MEQESDVQRLAITYAGLLQRWSSNHQMLWSTVAIALGAEAALFVGLTRSNESPILQLILGIGLAAVGSAGPLTVRYMETGIRLDRILLDHYEQKILGPVAPELLSHHTHRLPDRINDLMVVFDESESADFNRRRMTGIRGARWMDAALDAFGKPSILWTGVMAIAGSAGFAVGLVSELHDSLFAVLLIVLQSSVLPLIWVLSNDQLLPDLLRDDHRKGEST